MSEEWETLHYGTAETMDGENYALQILGAS